MSDQQPNYDLSPHHPGNAAYIHSQMSARMRETDRAVQQLDGRVASLEHRVGEMSPKLDRVLESTAETRATLIDQNRVMDEQRKASEKTLLLIQGDGPNDPGLAGRSRQAAEFMDRLAKFGWIIVTAVVGLSLAGIAALILWAIRAMK